MCEDVCVGVWCVCVGGGGGGGGRGGVYFLYTIISFQQSSLKNIQTLCWKIKAEQPFFISCPTKSHEPPRQGASNEYHNICFSGELRKNIGSLWLNPPPPHPPPPKKKNNKKQKQKTKKKKKTPCQELRMQNFLKIQIFSPAHFLFTCYRFEITLWSIV